EDAETLTHRGILYAPDYIINAGGIINASCEVGATYSEARARQKTERIYDTTQRVIHMAAREGITTAQAADRLAEERIEAVRSVQRA
ncbi:MAG: leucine dehydrogenase, partial [Dehalococcoidia bacterium]